MKIMTLCLTLLLFGIGNVNAQMPFISPVQPPIVEVPTVPVQTFSTYHTVRPNIMVYQWVPYVVTRPVVVNQRTLFCDRTYIINQPTIQWVYQLTYVNP